MNVVLTTNMSTGCRGVPAPLFDKYTAPASLSETEFLKTQLLIV